MLEFTLGPALSFFCQSAERTASPCTGLGAVPAPRCPCDAGVVVGTARSLIECAARPCFPIVTSSRRHSGVGRERKHGCLGSKAVVGTRPLPAVDEHLEGALVAAQL